MILHRLNHLLHFISFPNLKLRNNISLAILHSDPFTGTSASDFVFRSCRSGNRNQGNDCHRTCLVGRSTDGLHLLVSYLDGPYKVLTISIEHKYHYGQFQQGWIREIFSPKRGNPVGAYGSVTLHGTENERRGWKQWVTTVYIMQNCSHYTGTGNRTEHHWVSYKFFCSRFCSHCSVIEPLDSIYLKPDEVEENLAHGCGPSTPIAAPASSPLPHT